MQLAEHIHNIEVAHTLFEKCQMIERFSDYERHDQEDEAL